MKLRKAYIFFGVVEIISFINSIPVIINIMRQVITFRISDLLLALGMIQILLYLSFILTAILFFLNKITGFVVYYIQLVFRILVFSLSFSFILRINILFHSGVLYYILVAFVLLLEVGRLASSIFVHYHTVKKHNAD